MQTSTINSDLKPEEPINNPKDTIRISANAGSSRKLRVTPKLILVLSIVFLVVIVTLFFLNNRKELLSPVNTGKSSSNKDNGPDSEGISGISHDFENPLNGMYFSNTEAERFKDRKPVSVMVNNYVIARPSAGLSKADVVYEAVAEGGITRLMPIFYSRDPQTVSSIRSARYYFVELASGYKAHYIHWGAAHVPPCQKAPATSKDYCPPVNGKVETEPNVDAYDWIVKLGVPNLDGGNYSCDRDDCTFGRDPNKLGKVPLEHTAFVRFPLIFTLAKEIRPQDSWQKYIPIVEWKFKDDAPMSDRGDIGLTNPITYNYWETMPGFNVKWVYDKEKNEYIRYQGDVLQKDAENDEELRAKTVVIRFTEEKDVGDKKNHLYHTIVGTGEALIFEDGKVIKATWTRANPDDRDVYTDESKAQVEFVRGQIWVQLVPIGNVISYQASGTN